MSAVVPPEEKDGFIRAAMHLVENGLSFDQFHKASSLLVKEFPKTKGWFAWYLQPNRVELCFPACSSVSEGILQIEQTRVLALCLRLGDRQPLPTFERR